MLFPSAVLFILACSILPFGRGRSIDCLGHEQVGQYTDSPTLKLPWGTYQGVDRDSAKNVTVFKNVRYGKAPTGDLRFKKSEFPASTSNSEEIQHTASNPVCIQASAKDPPDGPVDGETEDCLFLDIYVPNKQFKKDADPIPVAVYFYGGAYFFGQKDTTVSLKNGKTFDLYNGKGLMDASDNDFVWVVGNYRVGALGFLAGSTMEDGGTPNAGLHDQRLILEFVKEYIELVMGDPGDVTVWGNSAGAGSVLFHLTATGWRDEPLFRKAVLQSPAFQPAFDRKGALEQTFKAFAASAGCGRDLSLSCLRSNKIDTAALRKANQDIVSKSLVLGQFPFGPALDGSLIQYLPQAMFPRRGYSANLQSIVVSHVFDESALFLPRLSWVNSEENFQQFLNLTYPGKEYADIREAITDDYPVIGSDDSKIAQVLRLRRVLRDSTFICHARQLYDRYNYAWMMQYSFPPGLHGSDLLTTTWNKDVTTSDVIGDIVDAIVPIVNGTVKRIIQNKLSGFSGLYQKYLAGYISYGNPNVFIADDDTNWEIAVLDRYGSRKIGKVLNVGLDAAYNYQFANIADDQISSDLCAFWQNVAFYIGDGLPADDDDHAQYKQRPFGLKMQPGRPGFPPSWEL